MKHQIDYIISQLRGYFPDEELRELAYWIVEETTGITRSQILSGCKDTKNISNIEIILQKLRAHEPIQYIFGRTDWMGLDLRLTPATLIPRPETAELVQWVLAICDTRAPMRVLDIGTGSGCMAIALKQRAPLWAVTGMDISPEALTVAKDNAVRNHVQLDWLQADILSPLVHCVLPVADIIVSNPPYICNSERSTMDSRVLDYEPHTALFVPDNDPLLFYRKIAALPLASTPRPMTLFFEINEAYGKEVCLLLHQLGYTNITLKKDMYGKERMVFATIDC